MWPRRRPVRIRLVALQSRYCALIQARGVTAAQQNLTLPVLVQIQAGLSKARRNGSQTRKTDFWARGVIGSTADSDSAGPGSNPGEPALNKTLAGDNRYHRLASVLKCI